MKQPGIGLWRKAGLRNNYLPLLFAAVLLLSSFCAKAQSYTTINGRYIYTDSIKLGKLKNNLQGNGFLSTDTSGRIILKLLDTTSLASKQNKLPVGTITQYLRGDLTIGSEARNEAADYSNNSTITLANTPLFGTLRLFKNGIILPAYKYSLSYNTITLTDARVSADIFYSDYKF